MGSAEPHLYLESSALLRWLLREPGGDTVERVLQRHARLVTSFVTRIEIERVIARGRSMGVLPADLAAFATAWVERAVEEWQIVAVGEPILARVRSFPREPVRTLDAIHLASALLWESRFPGTAMLSLDARIRENAESLGLAVLPEAG